MKKLPPLVDASTPLSADEAARYLRQTVIPEIGALGQARIKNAKVLSIGAGGLGSPVLMYLAAAGVGTLGIIDFDRVDLSNLQRQIIHGEGDVGRLKTESARAAINKINSSVNVIVHNVAISRENAMGIIAGYDIVIDATDNFATRYLVNDACVLLNKPCIWGSIFRFDGQASVFWSANGPCYRCLHPEPPAKELAPNCAVGGVFGVLCATIGSLQATEAIKLITGVGETMIGSITVYDALTSSFDRVPLNKDPNCPICGSAPTQTQLLDDYEAFCSVSLFDVGSDDMVKEITVDDLRALQNSGTAIDLIDVREENEWAEGFIPGARLIPQGEFFSGAALADVSKDSEIVVYCRSGLRSMNVAKVLVEAGYPKVVNVIGGILAWNESGN